VPFKTSTTGVQEGFHGVLRESTAEPNRNLINETLAAVFTRPSSAVASISDRHAAAAHYGL
jgi:hypothetical protein